MIASLKAEFRKIFSVRSTYIILLLCVALLVFFSFYVEGFRTLDQAALHQSGRLASEINNAITPLALILSLVGLLLFTHEYRYNTIMHTLTASNSRTKVLLAKIISISCFAIFFSLLFSVLSPALTDLAVHLRGVTLVHQVFPLRSLLLHAVFYGWGYSMAGLLLAALIRIQVGAIVAIFIIPSTLEQLLGLLLKHSTVYLPFTALGQVIGENNNPGSSAGHLSPGRGAMVFGVYLIVGWLVAWYLFLKRDAN